MERKFLAFSCLVLLISIVWFIYTSYQLAIKDKNQQEAATELAPPFVPSASPDRLSPSSEPEHSNPVPTQEEQEAFEEVIKDFEASEEQAEPAQSEVASETENSSTGISPELEAMFFYVKEMVNRDNAILDERDPYVQQLLEIQDRHLEVGRKLSEAGINDEMKNQLYEEFQKLDGEIKETLDILEPYRQQREKLKVEFEQKYGLSGEEFATKYYEAYRNWKRRL